MSRITHIELDGFKGQSRRHELGPLTLLTGPNGLGKSAVLEGLRYALSGEVPTGKTLDEVAKFFPPRGGAVLVIDADGNWIRRGITRDHEKAKVSQELEEEGGAEWYADESLLDMKNFLALSPNKRREFVLELVGAGSIPAEAEIHKALAAGYAKEIGGPGADVSILDGRTDELPDEIRPLAERWLSMWGVLSSYLRTGSDTASAIFQRLADAARERKNGARHGAAEAKAAIRELEAAVQGARAAAEDLERRRYEAEEAQDAFGLAREKAAERRALERAAKDAEDERGRLAASLAVCEKGLAGIPAPEVRSRVEESDEELALLRQELEAARQALAERGKREAFLAGLGDRLENAQKTFRRTMAEIEEHERSPIGRAVFLSGQIRAAQEGPETDSRITQLLGVIDEIASAWHKRNEQLVLRMLEEQQAVKSLEKESRGAGEPLDLAGLQGRERELAAEIVALERILSAGRKAEANRAAREAELGAYRAAHEKACQRHGEAASRLSALPSYPDVHDAEARAYTAKKALQAAEEAAGAVKAYEAALGRAADEKIAEAAWKAVEAAAKRARETYVADVVRPLVGDVARLLEAAGRSERVYLLLENERGKPVFELGWTAGDSRRSLSALSGGEAVLFTAALAVTIARRAGGRKILLLEADPLDEDNLQLLLYAIAEMDIELDACLIATSSDIRKDTKGWKTLVLTAHGSWSDPEQAHANEGAK